MTAYFVVISDDIGHLLGIAQCKTQDGGILAQPIKKISFLP